MREENKRFHKCSKGKKQKVENSLEVLMRGEEGAIVEDYLTKYKNKNKMTMKKFHQNNFYIDLK